MQKLENKLNSINLINLLNVTTLFGIKHVIIA